MTWPTCPLKAIENVPFPCPRAPGSRVEGFPASASGAQIKSCIEKFHSSFRPQWIAYSRPLEGSCICVVQWFSTIIFISSRNGNPPKVPSTASWPVECSHSPLKGKWHEEQPGPLQGLWVTDWTCYSMTPHPGGARGLFCSCWHLNPHRWGAAEENSSGHIHPCPAVLGWSSRDAPSGWSQQTRDGLQQRTAHRWNRASDHHRGGSRRRSHLY